MRQLGELWPDEALHAHDRKFGAFLDQLLFKLAELLGCKVLDLDLDHDPPLAARKRRGTGNRTVYTPKANDPAHLFYREHHAHHIKTNVRGDGAQYPDRVLIRRERQRREKKRAKPKTKWQSRPLRSANRWPKRKFR